MEKISRQGSHGCEIVLKSFDDVYDKLDEIVDWINKYDKLLQSTMQEAIQLMIEDMKNGNET